MKYYNTSIRNLVYRLRRFREILDEELEAIVLSAEDDIVDAVRDQMWSGFNGHNEEIAPSYTSSTIKKKIKKGQPYNRVTLKDTGEFYVSLYLKSEPGGFRIVSGDKSKKVSELINKYGDEILRISDGNFNYILNNRIRPELQRKLKEILLKK